MSTLSTLSATFNLPLSHSDLPAFRGALASHAGLGNDLFHNHDNDPQSPADYHQRYPLIQYRVRGGKAAVFGINQGAEALEKLIFASSLRDFRLNGHRRPLRLSDHYRDRGFLPVVTPPNETRSYRINRYLPFSAKAYHEYKSIPAFRDKIPVLERLLQNHIVAFAKGVNWRLPSDNRVTVTLNDLECMHKVKVVGQDYMAFNLSFSTTARLPEGLGLGRKTAFGFGTTVPSAR